MHSLFLKFPYLILSSGNNKIARDFNISRTRSTIEASPNSLEEEKEVEKEEEEKDNVLTFSTWKGMDSSLSILTEYLQLDCTELSYK